MGSPVDPKSGWWFLVGALGETVVSYGRQPSGSRDASLDVVAVASTIHATPQHEGFDYVDVSLFDKRSSDFPASYGGVSGAGLWRVGKEQDGKLHWDGKTVVLEGVGFVHCRPQSEVDEIIRCHGRRSIYDYLLTTSGLVPGS